MNKRAEGSGDPGGHEKELLTIQTAAREVKPSGLRRKARCPAD